MRNAELGLSLPSIIHLTDCSFAMARNLYPLASLSQIECTPSREDGIPEDLEEDLRAYGCKVIHQAGILLKQYAPCLVSPFFAS